MSDERHSHPGRRLHRKRVLRGTREGGQTTVLLVVLLMSLLGVAAFAIDYGLQVVNRSQVQSAADAAALAGAAGIPGGWGTATTYANGEQAKNGQGADSVGIAQTTDLQTNDSVTVTASRSVPTDFASLFGIHSVTVTATARATIESFTQMNGIGVMPWGVLQGSQTTGQPYPIYTKDTGNANNGALSLPYVSNANCPVPSGANVYSDEIAGTTQVCPVSVGETLQTKPGPTSPQPIQASARRTTARR